MPKHSDEEVLEGKASGREQTGGGADLELEITDDVRRMLQRKDLGEIRLDREGNWFHRGEPFVNRRVVDLFNRSIRPLKGGGFVLQIGNEVYPVQVDDTAYFVRSLDITRQPPVIELTDGTSEPLDPATLYYDDRRGLYCRVKDGRYRAKFRRNVWHGLLDYIVERPGGIFLDLGKMSIRLGDSEMGGE